MLMENMLKKEKAVQDISDKDEFQLDLSPQYVGVADSNSSMSTLQDTRKARSTRGNNPAAQILDDHRMAISMASSKEAKASMVLMAKDDRIPEISEVKFIENKFIHDPETGKSEINPEFKELGADERNVVYDVGDGAYIMRINDDELVYEIKHVKMKDEGALLDNL